MPVVRSLERKEDLQDNIDDIKQQIENLLVNLSADGISYQNFSSYLRDILDSLSGAAEIGLPPEVPIEEPPEFTEGSLPEAPDIEEIPMPEYVEKEATSQHVDNVISLTDYFEEVSAWYEEALEFLQDKIDTLNNLDIETFDLDLTLPDGFQIEDSTLEYIRASLDNDKAALSQLDQVINSIQVENLADDSVFTIPQEVRSAIDDTYKTGKRGVFDNADKITMYDNMVKALQQDAMKGWLIPTGMSHSEAINAQAAYFLNRQKKLQDAFTANATFLTDKVIATYLNYFKKAKLLSDIYGLNAFLVSQFSATLLDIQKTVYQVYLDQLAQNITNVSDEINNFKLTMRAIEDKGRIMALTAANKDLETQVKVVNIQSELTRIRYLRAQVDKYREDLNKTVVALTNQMQKASLYSVYVKMFREKVRLYDAHVLDYNTQTKNSFLSSLLFRMDADFKNYKTRALQEGARTGISSIKEYLARLDKYYSLVVGKETSTLEASLANLKADVETLAQEISNEDYRLGAQGQLNQQDLEVKLSLLRTQLAGYSKDITLALEKSEKELHSKIVALSSYDSAYALYLNRKIANILQSVRASVSMVTKLFEEI